MTVRAAVVGSGPNGLTAACLLARAGWEVTVYEAAEAPGGALRSEQLLEEGALSDLGASVHPLGAASPAFEALELHRRGLEWAHPGIPAAHGADDGDPPVLLHDSLGETAAGLGGDAGTWRQLIDPLAVHWETVSQAALSPPVRPFESLAGHPALAAEGGAAGGGTAAGGGGAGWSQAVQRAAGFARLGLRGGWPASALMKLFAEPRSRDLFAGLAAHATLPLTHPITGAFGLIFAAAAHSTGWPVARGGSQAIAEALVADLRAHGGRIETAFRVRGVHDVARPGGRPGARADRTPRSWRLEGRVGAGPNSRGRQRSAGQAADVVMLDLTPRQVLGLDGLQLAPRRARRLRRWDYGPGIVKVDFLLEGRIPWRHGEMARAGTVHLGGSAGQIAASEAAVARGVLPGRPYVLLAQPAAADASRAGGGETVCWAYAHVPHGLSGGAVRRAAAMIEAEIADQAPGFAAMVRRRRVWGPTELEAWNPNLVGGSISGGATTLDQMVARPALSLDPYASGTDGVFLCSSSTPPGSGAHGMSGYHAAAAALRQYA